MSRAPKGYYTQPEPPLVCLHCNEEVGPEHWRQVNAQRTTTGKSWDCLVRRRAYAHTTYERHKDAAKFAVNPMYSRWTAYRSLDRRRGYANDLGWVAARSLMSQACHYCGGPGGGLDRRDSDLGHTVANVVPCCLHCNNILSDLPAAAKDLLAEGLSRCRAAGIWGSWTPPIHRKRS